MPIASHLHVFQQPKRLSLNEDFDDDAMALYEEVERKASRKKSEKTERKKQAPSYVSRSRSRPFL
jgi:hypothetical protein